MFPTHAAIPAEQLQILVLRGITGDTPFVLLPPSGIAPPNAGKVDAVIALEELVRRVQLYEAQAQAIAAARQQLEGS